MDSLRPDSDDVSLYKKRSMSGKKADGNLTPASVSMRTKKIKETQSSPFTFFSWTLLSILLLALGFATYTYYQQTSKILKLETEIHNDRNFIRQTKLLMARLEGRLAVTGTKIQQTGSVVDKKLKFLDSQVRKLWGVSWDRNKKAIIVNTGKLNSEKSDRLAGERILTGELQKQNAIFNQKIKALNTGFLNKIKRVDTKIAHTNLTASSIQKVVAGNTQVLSQLMQKVRKLDLHLVALKATLDSELTKSGSNANLKKDLEQNSQEIKGINVFRGQVNSRVVSLNEQLSVLQRELYKLKRASGLSPKKVLKRKIKTKVSVRKESRVKRTQVP